MSAGRPARSSGVAGHGFVQFAEGLLDAGVDLVSTVGAVLDCSRWLGRELGQPCPRLVGDRTWLVALGAVEAIVRVCMRGVGHGDHPGSRSGLGRPGRRRGPGGTSRRRPGPLYPLPPAGSSQPWGDVISRSIRPGSYGEGGTAVAGPLGEPADGDLTTSGACLRSRQNLRSSTDECLAFPIVAVRERWRRPGWPRGGVPNPLPHPWAARIIRPARLLDCNGRSTCGPSGATLVSSPAQVGRAWRPADRPHSSHGRYRPHALRAATRPRSGRPGSRRSRPPWSPGRADAALW
jgi:hypothetical protein